MKSTELNPILKYNKVTKEITYKGHSIKKVVDAFGQEFFLVDNDSKLYFSLVDAKREIRGEKPQCEEFEMR